jgi:hypothetical protein
VTRPNVSSTTVPHMAPRFVLRLVGPALWPIDRLQYLYLLLNLKLNIDTCFTLLRGVTLDPPTRPDWFSGHASAPAQHSLSYCPLERLRHRAIVTAQLAIAPAQHPLCPLPHLPRVTKNSVKRALELTPHCSRILGF